MNCPAIIYFFIFSCYLSLSVMGQTDTLLVLPLVEISKTPIRTQSTGGKARSWHQENLQGQAHHNLADFLSREGGLFIKSYGLGSIATTSIRGGSAGHTSVLWNGLPIQSPMLGQLDFSLFPLAFVDQIQLHYGGQSAAWGSGAIGGLVKLQNEMPFDTTSQISLRSTLGSFGFFDQQFKLKYNNGKWGTSTRLFHQQANNDFSYKISPDLPEKRQTNAALRQGGILQSFYWKPSDNQNLSFHFWGQGSNREIPPNSVQNQSVAKQTDDFIRMALHWKNIQNKTIWQARLGVFRETIDFQDESIQLRALTGFWTAQAEIDGNWVWNKHQQFHFGLSHSWMTAEADAYQTPTQQNRTAPFLVYRHYLGAWQLQMNLRQEIVDGVFLPIMPGLALQGDLTSWLNFQAKISRNYRLPTFNDLYWQPGGNPELLAESGWSMEGGFRIKPSISRGKLSYQITGFNRQIENWILWSRPEGQAFWSSNNIARVWSRGLEQYLQWDWSNAKLQVRLQAGYDHILSTNEVALENPRLEEGAQLIYVPKHQAFGSISWQWKKLAIQYRHTYTGSVSSINEARLPAYHLGFYSIQYTITRPTWNAQLFFQIQNVWDTDYRVIERRPMPGRHFQTGIQFQLQHKNHR